MLAFWLTCLLEAPWWVLGLRAFGVGQHRTVGWWPAVWFVVGVNLVTHPLVWQLTASRDLRVWVAAEVGAVLVEGLIVAFVLRGIGARRPWTTAALLSVGANATTALVGVLFF